MRPRDAVIGTLVALAWGLNFVAIGKGLKDLPPLLFVALRFLLASVPVVFFVQRPGVGVQSVVLLGLFAGVGTFGFMFLGVAAGMPAGLSSVVVQAQMPFTVILAALLLRERPSAGQLAGLAVAVAGLLIIAVRRGDAVPAAAVLLLVAGAASWAAANVLARSVRSVRPFSLLVHSSLAAGACMLVLSLVFEGAGRDAAAIRGIGWHAGLSLAYIVVVATLGGYGAWYWLLGRYDSSTVSAFPLLAPVAALSSTWILLGEEVSGWQLTGALLVVVGVGGAIWSSGQGRRAVLTATGVPLPAGAAGH